MDWRDGAGTKAPVQAPSAESTADGLRNGATWGGPPAFAEPPGVVAELFDVVAEPLDAVVAERPDAAAVRLDAVAVVEPPGVEELPRARVAESRCVVDSVGVVVARLAAAAVGDWPRAVAVRELPGAVVGRLLDWFFVRPVAPSRCDRPREAASQLRSPDGLDSH